jgi:hypothetical protein
MVSDGGRDFHFGENVAFDPLGFLGIGPFVAFRESRAIMLLVFVPDARRSAQALFHHYYFQLATAAIPSRRRMLELDCC